MKFIKTQSGSLLNAKFIKSIYPEQHGLRGAIIVEIENSEHNDDGYILAKFFNKNPDIVEQQIADSIDNLLKELNGEDFL